MNKIPNALSTIFFSIVCIVVNTVAYNWSWDQNHDCTKIKGVTGRYGSDGKFNPDPCCPCKTCNVYSLSGAYFETATDITLAGNGPLIALSRTWNSNDLASGLVGNGWTFSLGRNVVQVKGNDRQEYLIVKRNNGQEIRMIRQGSSYEFTTNMKFGFKMDKIPTGWKLTEQDGTINEYNNDGKLARIIDRNGLAVILLYNASGCLNGLTNASSQRLDFTLNPNGKLETVVDNHGRAISFTYDGGNNLTRVDYWDGSAVTYTYDSQNLLRTVSNRRGQVIREIAYNQQGQAIEVREKGEIFYFVHDQASRTIKKTDSKGRVWAKIYDENSINILERDPLGFEIKRQPNNNAGPNQFEWTENQNGNRTSYSYNSSGDMISRTDPLGNTEYWTYDENHSVTSYTDVLGTIFRYIHDAQGNMTEKKEAAGTTDERVWQYTYDNQGNMLSETNPAGAITTYEFDSLGNKTKQIGPLGETILWTYDSLGQLKNMTDPMGYTWTYTFDDRGNQLTETDPLGNVNDKVYDLDNNLIAETDALGNRTAYAYDGWNRLIMRIGPLLDTTIQQWITIGDEDELSGIRDAIGHWTYYQYDNGGRKIEEIVKMGDVSSKPDSNDLLTNFTYDPVGNVLKITKPEGDTTWYTYDENDQLIRKCNGMGECTQTEYDNKGRVSKIFHSNGNVIYHEYNSMDSIVRLADKIGVVREKKYDISGNKTWDLFPGYFAMIYEYDKSDRLIHEMDSVGVGKRYTYDSAGRIVASVDSLGNITQYGYDALGRRIWTLNALGDTIKNQYDANNNHTAMIDPDGNATYFFFDAAGRNVATLYPDSSTDSNYYNKVSQIKSKKDPRQVVTTFVYDDAGRLIRKKYSDSTSENDYTYDKNGRKTTANNSLAQLNWQYDEAGRIVKYTQKIDGRTNVLRYSYDVANRVSAMIYPDGKIVKRKMDLRNRLDSVVVDENLIAVDYDYIGMAISTKKLGNGIVEKYTYNAGGRIARIAYIGGTTTLPDITYGYDMSGNIRYVLNHHKPEMSETYEYDATSRLIRWRRGLLSLNDTMINSPNYFQEWILDKNGNWSRFNNNGRIENRIHNKMNELISIDNQIYTYDENGNTVSDGNIDYSYDAENKLIKAGAVSYGYDAIGRRLLRKDKNGNKDVTIMENWQEILNDNSIDSKKLWIYGESIDEMYITIENKLPYFALTNHQNSLIAILTETQGIVESYHYAPYGKFTILDSNNNVKNALDAISKLTYTGRYYDAGLNAYDFRHRFYSAESGRFLQRDPAGYIDGNNLYINYFNVNASDPYGLAITNAQCKKAIGKAKKNLIVKELIKQIKDRKCKTVKVICDCCKIPRMIGEYKNKKITVCENNINNIDEVLDILIHEYTHAFDGCLGRFTSCKEIACSEIRAHNMDGGCHNRPGWLPYKQCILSKAIESMEKNNCPDITSTVIEMMEKCYFDP